MKKLCLLLYFLLVTPLWAQTWQTQDYHGLTVEFPATLSQIDHKELPSKRLLWSAHYAHNDLKISLQYLWDPDGIDAALGTLERMRDGYQAKYPDFSGRPVDVDRPEGAALMSFKLDGEDHLIFIARAPYEQWTLQFTAPDLEGHRWDDVARILHSLRLASKEGKKSAFDYAASRRP